MAAFYHPDNKQTGNEEKFKRVLKAYEVLSDPGKAIPIQPRISWKKFQDFRRSGPKAWFARSLEELKAKLEVGTEAANSRRAPCLFSERELRKLMLMALYDVRRNTPANPEVSLLVLAELLSCAIENLEFSNWYLKEKGYIKITESADFSITNSRRRLRRKRVAQTGS